MTPDDFTNQELMLEVGDGHTLYVHDWGAADAKVPILFLHGGPGGGCNDGHKGWFDPTRQRVIFHDQRGSGKSTPYGSLEHNTTQDLVGDIDKIADKFNLDKFILTGSSWGSGLALAYGLAQPQLVTAMVLGGIFTGSQAEIDWIDQGRFVEHFPDAWDAYLATVPAKHRTNPTAYHVQRMFGDDAAAARQSAYDYGNLSSATYKLDDRLQPQSLADDFDPVPKMLEAHYMANGCFMPDNYILDHAGELTMPIWLVQGRYDFICPPRTAYELDKRLPNSELIWTISGHKYEREDWQIRRQLLLRLTADR